LAVSRTAADARHKTRVRRERRADAEVKVSVGERVEVEWRSTVTGGDSP